MSIVDEKFRMTRLDQSPYLFHFVRGTLSEAKETMTKIINTQKLKSLRDDYICFTASPITAVLDFFKTTVNRTGNPMYQPYGIGFCRDLLIQNYGARNVIYGSEEELSSIPSQLKWRSLQLDIGKYDFEYLREWRIKGCEFDFSSFPKEQILIVAPTPSDINDLVIRHDIVFYPEQEYYYKYRDYYKEYDEPNEEVFYRMYKGLSIEEIASCKNDYDVSGSTASQEIGEDMYKNFLSAHSMLSGSTQQTNFK